jgi:hypothetical protein
MLSARIARLRPDVFVMALAGTVIVATLADSSDRRNTIFVGLSGDTGTVPRIASL